MPEQKLDINLPEEVAKGTYSNLAIISHSNSEFIIDFASMMRVSTRAMSALVSL